MTSPNHTLRAVKKLARVKLLDHEAADITALRLAVKANGYTPIPTRDKRTLLKGWNALWPTEEIVRAWINPRATLTFHPATGLLIVDGLATVDCDIPDPAVAKVVREAIERLAPHLFGVNGALERGRDDNSPKCMLFCRRAGAPFTVKSRRWSLRPDDKHAPTFQIEIFASERDVHGNARRQVGAFGPHTIDDETGEVRVRYLWNGPSPAEAPLADRLEIDKATAMAIAVEVDRILESRGMKEVKGHPGGVIEWEDVYDLDENTRFDGDGFDQITLEELIELYWGNQAIGDGAARVRS